MPPSILRVKQGAGGKTIKLPEKSNKIHCYFITGGIINQGGYYVKEKGRCNKNIYLSG